MSDYGARNDGTKKGRGYFGEIKTPKGGVMTEYSVRVNLDGAETEIPAIVPGISAEDVRHFTSNGKPSRQQVDKAVEHAKARRKAGRPFFADDDDVALPVPTDKSDYAKAWSNL